MRTLDHREFCSSLSFRPERHRDRRLPTLPLIGSKWISETRPSLRPGCRFMSPPGRVAAVRGRPDAHKSTLRLRLCFCAYMHLFACLCILCVCVCVCVCVWTLSRMWFGFHGSVIQPLWAETEEGKVWQARINEVLKHQLTVWNVCEGSVSRCVSWKQMWGQLPGWSWKLLSSWAAVVYSHWWVIWLLTL